MGFDGADSVDAMYLQLQVVCGASGRVMPPFVPWTRFLQLLHTAGSYHCYCCYYYRVYVGVALVVLRVDGAWEEVGYCYINYAMKECGRPQWRGRKVAQSLPRLESYEQMLVPWLVQWLHSQHPVICAAYLAQVSGFS